MVKASGEAGAAVWRWAGMGALLATIPAFYIELVQAEPSRWAALAYALAAAVIGARLLALPAHRRSAEPLLALGLLLAAALPASSRSNPALALRFGVAALSLGLMIWEFRRQVTRGSVVYLILSAGGVLLLCGVGFWWLEPQTPTLADGLWLAFTTAATVGYGDLVPSTTASRIFSVFVVLLGLGVLALTTAAIASAWIETEERRIERKILANLHHEIAALREEVRQLAQRLPGSPPD